MNTNPNRSNTLTGLALLGAVVTGAIGLVAALFPFFDGDFAAGGVCLIAAALSFGLLANAALRE